MRITTVTCDRCKRELSADEIEDGQPWGVEVRFSNRGTVHLKAEWCRSCMVEMGMLNGRYEETKQPIVDPPPTIEDFIREIVREEINGG
jgi:hypothetical protein